MSETKKHILQFAYGESVQEPGTIVMRFKETGIDLTNPKHRDLMDAICPEISAALFALAHDIEVHRVTIESETVLEAQVAKGSCYSVGVTIGPESIIEQVHRAQDTKANLCDSCMNHPAECSTSPDELQYGDAQGNDNVIFCRNYYNGLTLVAPK